MNLRRIVMTTAAFAVVPLALTAAAIPAQAQVQAPTHVAAPAATTTTVTCDTVTSLAILAIGMGNCDMPGGINVSALNNVTLTSRSTGASTSCQGATVEANGTVVGVGCGGLGLPGLPGLPGLG